MSLVVRSTGKLSHPSLPGVLITKIGAEAAVRGKSQKELVEIEPNGLIPLHTHTVDAMMIIVAGNGWTCCTDGTDGTPVSSGDCIFFEAEQLHGFRAGEEGLSFMTVNGGIVDENPANWDIKIPS